MARKEKEKKEKKEKKVAKSLDPKTVARVLKVSGIVVAVFAFFTLIACVSYLFTWKVDQSLLSDPSMMSKNVSVHNWGGKLGYRWADLLIADCLGLGSFALVILLFVAAWHLFFRTKPSGIIRMVLVTFSGSVLCAAILSFCSRIFCADTFFSGGLGGRMGAGMADGLVNLIGHIGTGLVLLVCLVVWLIFSSKKFAEWLTRAFEPKPKPEQEPEAEPAPSLVERIFSEEEAEVEPEQEPEEEPEPEAEPEPVKAPVAPEVIDPEARALSGGEQISPEDFIPADEPADDNLTIVEGEDFQGDVEELERLDIRKDLENYKFPSIDLLDSHANMIHSVSKAEVEMNNTRIRSTLESYKIQVDTVTAIVGPTVTLYKVKLAPGVKSATVKTVEKDIAMALGNESVRVTSLADAVGIEVANETKSVVPLKAMFNDPSFRESKAELPVAIGYTIEQKVKTFDLADAPHLLVAGATKQGKSVGLNVIVSSLLYAKHPSELKFVFVDPKMVEFTAYKSLAKHYLAAMPTAASDEDEANNIIVKSAPKAEEILHSLCIEMDDRYLLLSQAGVNKLKDYNEKFASRHLRPDKGHHFLPYLVVVIDEYADLIMSAGSDTRAMSKKIQDYIIRLAQKGRAAGIHVIIATQRPSVNVITGLIKSNFPMRIAFRVTSRIDSMTILDNIGAEKLIGKGDMLFYDGIKMERIQCAYVSTPEIDAINEFISKQDGFRQHYSTPYYLPEIPVEAGEAGEGGGMVDIHKLDANFEEAARMVVTYQKGSTSDIQRRLGMGYARAGKVMDQLEAAGIVGPQEGSKPRQVLVSTLADLEPILEAFLNK